MAKFLKSIAEGEEGATMVEYALMIALVGAALFTVVRTMSTAIGGKYTVAATSITAAS